MKNILNYKTFSKSALIALAFVVTVTGISFGGGQTAKAASYGFKVYNNCGTTKFFRYNYYNTAPGTGINRKVLARQSMTTYTGGTGIYRVELPRGTYNTFVYSTYMPTLYMC